MRLVDDWRESVRWVSMWCFASIATIQGSVMAFLTQDQLEVAILFYPEMTWGGMVQSVIAFLAVTGGVGRLISQKAPDDPDQR